MAEPTRDSHEFAQVLVGWVTDSMAALERAHAPGLRLPGIFAGHRVDGSSQADLVYTLGLLAEAGVDEIGGISCALRARQLIAEMDPSEVEGFAAYRVSETVLRLTEGQDAWTSSELEHALATGDSAAVVEAAAKGELPTNWIAVAARCLAGVEALGAETTRMEELTTSLRDVFEAANRSPGARGWLDDSGGWGDQYAAYDIYTPDMYLFAQPLADEIGTAWQEGLRSVLADLDDLAQPGGAVVWGRSVGALSLAITVELAGVVVSHNLSEGPDRWLARAAESFADLRDWFSNGVITAHQGRQPMFYRGPARRLQMTLDIYGKVLLAALELRRSKPIAFRSSSATWPESDRLITFDPDVNAAVWTAGSRAIRLALPLLASWSTDYAPAPRSPGLFEVPTSGHPCFLPSVSQGDKHLIPAGMPTSIDASPGRLEVEYAGWAPAGSDAGSEDALAGTRRATYTVSGRSLKVVEELEFEAAPQALTLSLSVPALQERPLDVNVDHAEVSLQTIDTGGIAEWRSFWSELPVLHQAEMPMAPTVNFSWSVTPQLRVASAIYGHQYDKCLYGPLEGELVEVPTPPLDDDLTHGLRSVDILHMAWPEWWTGVDPEHTSKVLEQVRAAGVKIVWTQHNLSPHFFKTEDASACYQQWAAAADAVIHHTEWGMGVALATYDYGPGTVHTVLPHGHWGAQYPDAATLDRAALEADLGWPHAEIRLGVIGTPRVEKDLQLVLDAFAQVDRPDMHLVIRLDGSENVPDDPRITIDRGSVPDHLYHRRVHAIDALIMPFAPMGMMTTGTAFDAIGSGTAAITSEWEFFDETFAGCDIRYGSTVEDLAHCLSALSREQVAESGEAIGGLQGRFEWEEIARSTLDLFESLYED